MKRRRRMKYRLWVRQINVFAEVYSSRKEYAEFSVSEVPHRES